ncbi:snoRNA-binding rRNA-processing protein [Saccharomycopsis crataegensis]|uniref:SnoRNA-binding rRNA-processing protein n=1 Tax=Saccharomycopsis crataegensis TaxID=43959 RepID=A0AAV5QKD4_9ASCO|nr:snoRNA-binding rRNA-processing protein [Saccharomycopsis crataegensis]
MSEKVRYFLEQSVPELQDLQNKGLFEKNEITMIMRRRTDFEHRIQARGCKPKDFIRYLEFEKNLEKLRGKRFNRYKKVGACDTRRSLSDYAGVKRIFFIYERAVDRYPNEISLWNNYLLYAKKNGSVKTVYNIYTKVLQIHPTNIRFWISAANYEFEENFNVKASRVLFQKALRFNAESLDLWLAYTEFELLYITKLLERRRILGLLTEKQQQENEGTEVKKSIFENQEEDEDDDNVLKLPNNIDDDVKQELKQLPEADMNMLGNPEQNPALRGDIALTIFDVAFKTLLKHKAKIMNSESKFLKQTKEELVLGYAGEFLVIFDKFKNLNRSNLSGHVINHVLQLIPHDTKAKLLDIALPIRYDTIESQNFVDDLKLSVNKFMAYKSKMDDSKLTGLFVEYLNDQFINNVDNEHLNSATEKTVATLQVIIKKISN